MVRPDTVFCLVPEQSSISHAMAQPINQHTSFSSFGPLIDVASSLALAAGSIGKIQGPGRWSMIDVRDHEATELPRSFSLHANIQR